MEGNHPIEELMVTAMNSIKDMIDANTIVGEPIKALDNTVIIPISKVGFGFAAGGSEFSGETINYYNRKNKEENVRYRLPFGGGSGAGVNIMPIAFLIVQNDSVKLLEASHTSVLDKLVEYIPDAMDKISSFFKSKLDDKKSHIDEDFDEFEDDELDGDFKDDEWLDDEDDDFFSSESDDIKDNNIIDENEEQKKRKDNRIKEVQKKEVNQIIDNGKGKTKKLEEKIKEIKKDSTN
jgi:sporulation protein YtfJ